MTYIALSKKSRISLWSNRIILLFPPKFYTQKNNGGKTIFLHSELYYCYYYYYCNKVFYFVKLFVEVNDEVVILYDVF